MTVRDVLDAVSAAIPGIVNLDDKAMVLNLYDATLRLMRENDDLRNENRELREEISSRAALAEHDGAYYYTAKDGTEEGPICPECYLGKGLVYLLVDGDWGAECSVCHTRYEHVRAKIDGRHARVG